MTLDDIRPHLQEFTDADLVTLLMEVSDEVKRRNTILQGILGSTPPTSQRETLQKGFEVLFESLGGKPKT